MMSGAHNYDIALNRGMPECIPLVLLGPHRLEGSEAQKKGTMGAMGVGGCI